MNFKVGDRRCSLILAALILSSLSAHGLEISGSPDRIPAEIRMPLNLNAEPSDPLGSAMDFPLLSAGLGTVDAGPVEEKRDSPFFLNSSPRQSVSRGPVLSASVAMTVKKKSPAELSRLKGLASLRLGQAFDSSRSFFDGAAYNAGNSPQPRSVFENEEPIILEGHGDWVHSAAFSPDGSKIITASHDGTAKIWDAKTGQLLRTLEGHKGWVFRAAFSPHGSKIVTASWYGTARIWDAETGELLRTLKGHSDSVWSAAFSPDGSKIVTASDETVEIWDAETGQLIRTWEDNGAHSAAYSPDGSKIATTSGNSTAKILDANTGQLIRTLKDHSATIYSVAFILDGSKIVTTSYDDTTKIWDADTGQLIRTLKLKGHDSRIPSVAFSPDGSKIVTNGEDNTAKIWDAATGRELIILKGHSALVRSATFSPDGSKIVTASSDGTARIWLIAKQIENLKREVELAPAPKNTPVHDDFTIPGWKAAIKP